MNITLYTDGASRGNPGPASIGIYAENSDTKEALFSKGYYIGKATNNVAEYLALVLGLEHIIKHYPDAHLTVCADSLLLVQQIKGVFKVKHPNIIPLYKAVMELRFTQPFAITHVRRELNTHADNAANKALDEKIVLPKDSESRITRLL
jgi:ribonuclease HI